MQMLYDTVLLQEFKEESKIIMADHASELVVGIVVAVGPGQIVGGSYTTPTYEGFHYVPVHVKVGDKVIFLKDHALKWKEYLICKERDILAVV